MGTVWFFNRGLETKGSKNPQASRSRPGNRRRPRSPLGGPQLATLSAQDEARII